MSALPCWSVRNRVAVNIFTIALLIAGAFAGFTRLTRALFPDINTNFIRVTTIDPTTSVAEDIERTISIPLEDELANVEGVKKLTTFSQDNVSIVFLELESDITEIDPVLNEVRQAVDKAKPDLPLTAEVPVVEKFDIPMPLLTMSVSHAPTEDPRLARAALDRMERRLRTVPGVSDVLVDGLEDKEVWVEIDPFKMESLGLSFAQIAETIRKRNLNVVAGRVEGPGGERVVRVLGEIEKAEDLRGLPIKQEGGRPVLLGDIASIKTTSQEERTRGRTNLSPSVTFTVVKKKGADAIDVVRRAREVFAQEAKLLPGGHTARVSTDSTKFINTRIETVLKNGIVALLLVTVLLMLFLNWRLGLIVAFGLPVSFAGTFLVLYLGGYTINLLSLFAMIMALGMVVDDAIVIGENCMRYLEMGLKPADAAIRGAGEVIWPVIGSVGTTVAAFLPLMLAEGIIGKFLVIVPIVVVSTLAFSLIQAFLVMPSHFADFVKRMPEVPELEDTLRHAPNWRKRAALRVSITYKEMRNFVNEMVAWLVAVYMHLLNICLRRRYWVVAGFIASLVAVGAALGLGVVKFKLFGGDFADQIIVKLALPADASLDETEEKVARVEDAIARELPRDDLAGLITRVGARLDPTNQFLTNGTNLAMITVDVDEENPLCRKASVIERHLNEILREFPEFTEASARAEEGGPPVGRAVNIEISGENFAEMEKIAAEFEAKLHGVDGVFNIGNDFERGKTEYRVRLDDARASGAGVDVEMVGRALRGAFQGLEAARIRWGSDEVTIRVKMAERYKKDPEMLRTLRIRNARGEMIDLTTVADIVETNGIARVKRQNQERLISVAADVDDRVMTSAEVNHQVRIWIPAILRGHPGYSVNLAGENEDTERSVESMKFAALIAMLLIYTLLATITNSFFLPVVIMSVIPFGVVGVVLGLVFMGEPLGLMSIMGVIALAGIVVNNSVVFVDFINQYRAEAYAGGDGQGQVAARDLSPWIRWRSIMMSGRVRFRPILLTTGTTVAGLMSLAFTTSGQEQFLAPMAQAIVFGLSFATLLTMVLIPCLFAILDDVYRLLDRKAPVGS